MLHKTSIYKMYVNIILNVRCFTFIMTLNRKLVLNNSAIEKYQCSIHEKRNKKAHIIFWNTLFTFHICHIIFQIKKKLQKSIGHIYMSTNISMCKFLKTSNSFFYWHEQFYTKKVGTGRFYGQIKVHWIKLYIMLKSTLMK